MNVLQRLLLKLKKKVNKDFKGIQWKNPLILFLCVLLVFLLVGSAINGCLGLNRKIVIELDAAFGGDTKGYQGIVTSATENEKIVDALETILNEDHRFVAKKTQEDGTYASIEQRKEQIEKDNPTIVISIRLQGSPYPEESGMYTYAQLSSMKKHKESKKLANAINDVFKEDTTTNIGYLYYAPIKDTDTYELLFKDIEEKEVKDLETFALMEQCESTPVVVISPFYVTNQSEVDTYANEEGYQRIAQKIYQAICNFNGLEVKNNE